jgi:hypothetical protein
VANLRGPSCKIDIEGVNSSNSSTKHTNRNLAGQHKSRHIMRPCFVWFLLDRPSPSSWNKIINYVQAPDSTIPLYRNISGFTGEPFRKIGWKVFQNFVRAPQRKMHKSANPNLKNPAANSKPKMIRWCTFFLGQKLQISHLVHTCCHTNAQVSYRMAFPRFVWLFLGACRVSLSSETGIQYDVLSFYIEARGAEHMKSY